MRRQWARTVGAAVIVASVSSGAFASSAAARDDGGSLLVLDRTSGERRWIARPHAGRVLTGTNVGSQVITAGETRCVGDGEGDPPGRLIGFDHRSGERRWTVRSRSTPVVWTTTFSANRHAFPVDASGVVVTADGHGIDARTGTQRWTLPDTFVAGVSRSLAYTAGNGALTAYDRRTGKQRWSFPPQPDAAFGAVADVLDANDDTLIVASGGYLARVGDTPSAPTTIFVLDARTGRERARWAAADPQVPFSDAVIADDTLVYVESGAVIARSLADGATRWQRPYPPGSASINVSGVLVLRSGTAGIVFAADQANGYSALDTRTGDVVWSISTPNSAVAASRGRLTVLQDRQRLRAFDTTTGKLRWHAAMPSSVSGRVPGELSIDAGPSALAVSLVCPSS